MEREVRDLAADAPRHGGHEGVVGVEHDPAAGLGDAADRRLDLGQLGECVDALQVQVVGRDVGQNARLVRLVADAAQDDPAAGGLEDRHVDVAAGQDLLRAARSRPVTGVDHPLVDDDPVRGGHPDMAAGAQQDVRDHPRDRALAVGARDRDDRDPALGVADPRGRRRPRFRDAVRPAPEQPRLRAGEVSVADRRDVALGQRQGGLGDDLGSLGAAPRDRDDPVPRIRGAVDTQPAGPLAVVLAQPPQPRRQRGDAVGPGRRRDRRAEPDERVARGVALPVPGPSPADGDLELDHRLQPVDVGAFEEAGLDQSHGPGRIATRLGAMDAPTALPDATTLAGLRAAIEADLPAYLADLQRFVDIDCGSFTPEGVDTVGRWTAAFFEGLGGRVEVRPDPAGRLGATVVTTFDGAAGGPRVMLIGHLDTVFDPGTAAARPFKIVDGIATGPGVTDMKSGLLAGLYAIKALIGQGGGRLPFERLVFVANPDEEIGSPSSTPHIRALAAEMDACLVLECARANGDIVSSRKGIRDLRIDITGRAAHAGVEPEKGRSAILEAARIIRDLHALNGRWPGVTVNVGVVAGGTRFNVVPEHCRLDVDVRGVARAELEAAEAEIRRIAAATEVPDTTVAVEVDAGWWPMEKLARSGRLVDHAKGIANALGFDLGDAATGGASDANTTSGMGIPSLDGLGPIGGNDHAPGEYLEVASIVPRTTLVAGLLLAIAQDPQVLAWRDAPA